MHSQACATDASVEHWQLLCSHVQCMQSPSCNHHHTSCVLCMSGHEFRASRQVPSGSLFVRCSSPGCLQVMPVTSTLAGAKPPLASPHMAPAASPRRSHRLSLQTLGSSDSAVPDPASTGSLMLAKSIGKPRIPHSSAQHPSAAAAISTAATSSADRDRDHVKLHTGMVGAADVKLTKAGVFPGSLSQIMPVSKTSLTMESFPVSLITTLSQSHSRMSNAVSPKALGGRRSLSMVKAQRSSSLAPTSTALQLTGAPLHSFSSSAAGEHAQHTGSGDSCGGSGLCSSMQDSSLVSRQLPDATAAVVTSAVKGEEWSQTPASLMTNDSKSQMLGELSCAGHVHDPTHLRLTKAVGISHCCAHP